MQNWSSLILFQDKKWSSSIIFIDINVANCFFRPIIGRFFHKSRHRPGKQVNTKTPRIYRSSGQLQTYFSVSEMRKRTNLLTFLSVYNEKEGNESDNVMTERKNNDKVIRTKQLILKIWTREAPPQHNDPSLFVWRNWFSGISGHMLFRLIT